jgi:hypothetical protein
MRSTAVLANTARSSTAGVDLFDLVAQQRGGVDRVLAGHHGYARADSIRSRSQGVRDKWCDKFRRMFGPTAVVTIVCRGDFGDNLLLERSSC